MERDLPVKPDAPEVRTPCYVCDEGVLRNNLEKLASVRQRTGCMILLALKGFAMHAVFPLARKYLQGVCASSPYEARLGSEEFGGEVHVYAPAYTSDDIEAVLPLASHLVFNSFAQWDKFSSRVLEARPGIRCGLRVNPEYSEVDTALYNPCARYSRLGITREQFEGRNLRGVSGLHFHSLCEQNADALEHTLEAFEFRFGGLLQDMEWVNFGGGHHITREDYDIDLLCELIEAVQKRYGVQVYLEPGEAIALNAGVLTVSVLDIVKNEMEIAILDTSATAHMPDVLEMPYRPDIVGAGQPGEFAYTYRLGGLTCLAGDVIGDYSFREPLAIGQRLVFQDMAHYTMVKNTFFNGIQLPAIAIRKESAGAIEVVREFGYEDYRDRLS